MAGGAMDDETRAEFMALRTTVTAHQHALFGITGQNGLNGLLKDIDAKLDTYIEKDAERREQDAKDRLVSQRAVSLALLAAVVALIGTIVTLIAVT